MKKINEASATDAELYATLKNDPARYTEVMTHKYDGTKKPKNYPREITRIVKVDKPQKPKPQLHPKPTYINGNVIDLHPYLTDEFWKDLKLSTKPVEENLFETYLEMLKAGELLPGTTFEKFEKDAHGFDMDTISKLKKEINKRVAQQKRSEGIAYLLGETI